MEPQTVLARVAWAFRKLYRLSHSDSCLTWSRCDCPPPLNTFVSAVADSVARGAAFPTGELLSLSQLL